MVQSTVNSVGPVHAALSRAVSDRPKRLLICGMNYAPEPIGVGRYTGDLGAYLSQQGNEVAVVTAVPHYPGWAVRDGYRNRYSTEYVSAVRVARCPLLLKSEMRGIWRTLAPLSFALSSAPVVVWRILTWRPDTVLCVVPSLLSAPAALLAAKLVGARTVLHVQDLEIDAAFAVGHLRGGLFKKLICRFEKALISAFDFVITISSAMRIKLEAKGIEADRVGVIRNWVDLENIRVLASSSLYRRELGIAERDFVVQYAGNIGVKQALPIVLGAAARLVSRPNIVFVIAGEGPEKARLEATYGHLPNVRFTGLQPEARLCEFLNLADLHVIPQAADAADLVLPSKLGGMLASGKPVLAMAEPGTELAEFLRDAAIIIPPGDSAALVAAIEAQAAAPISCLCRGKAAALTTQLDRRKNLAAFSAALFPVATIVRGGCTSYATREG